MYHVDITNKGDSTFQVKSRDYELVVDTEGKGITPPDTLLASLGSCIGVYIMKYIQGTKLPIKGFAISVDAEFTKAKPICFKLINVVIDFKSQEFDQRRKQSLLEFIKNCPVHNTLEASPQVEINIK